MIEEEFRLINNKDMVTGNPVRQPSIRVKSFYVVDVQ